MNSFFLDIATPGKWLSDEVRIFFSTLHSYKFVSLIFAANNVTQHMHLIMQMLWRRRGSVLQKDRMVMFDPYFTKFITSNWLAFNEVEDKLDFDWGTNIAVYIKGKSRGKNLKLELGRDVGMVYAPMHWGRNHWVGLCINLRTSNVTVLDSFITENPTEADVDVQMTPIMKSLPYILEQYVRYTVYQISKGVRFYSWNRVEGIYHKKRVVTVRLAPLSLWRCILMVMGKKRCVG